MEGCQPDMDECRMFKLRQQIHDALGQPRITCCGQVRIMSRRAIRIRLPFIRIRLSAEIEPYRPPPRSRRAPHIIDQGIGILPGDLNRITQSFYRGQNTKDYNGKGIGLSMAHVILTLHKIQLEIAPNQPRGTVVKLRLF